VHEFSREVEKISGDRRCPCTSPQQHRAKFGQHYRIYEVYRYPPTNSLNLHSQLLSHFLSFFSYHHTNITRDVNLWRVSGFTVACILTTFPLEFCCKIYITMSEQKISLYLRLENCIYKRQAQAADKVLV
jgi:hypothetical protein